MIAMQRVFERGLVSIALAAALSAGAASAVTPGFVEDFTSGTGGFASSTPLSNPGTGGVGGAEDGYLLLNSSFPANFGAMTSSPDYTGNWDAAGIQQVSFYLNDVGADQTFAFHLLLSTGGSSGTTWQHNAALDPPNGQWQLYTLNVLDESEWTRTRGTLSLAQVRQSVGTFHFRHDLPPYFEFPDVVAGDLGVDGITLIVPEPALCGVIIALPLLMLRRRHRCGR